MSDHVGFVSPDPLPPDIPSDRFYLSDPQTYQVQAGQWFGRAAVVIYARQSHAQTARAAAALRWDAGSTIERGRLEIATAAGPGVIEIDFASQTP